MTDTERTEQARAAAHARWDAATPDERAEAARRAALARWADHEPRPKVSARTPRPCPYCGRLTPMSRTQRTCGEAECQLARTAERMADRWARTPPPAENTGG